MTRNGRTQYGSVSKRGTRPKVWVGRWRENAKDPDGSIRIVRKAETLGTVLELPTKRDAERELWERIGSRQGTLSGSSTLRQLVETSWKPAVFPSVKYSTQLFYMHYLNRHILPQFGDVPLRLITRDNVQRFLHEKGKSGLSWTSVKQIRLVFQMLMSAAEMDDFVRQNVVKKTRLPRRTFTAQPRTVSVDDLRRLLVSLEEPSKSIAGILVLTGLRIGEILALRWMDVDLTARFLHVRQSVYKGRIDTPKTKRSNRCVPLAPMAIEILSRLPKGKDATSLIFASRAGSPLCRRNLINRQLKPTAAKLKIAGVNWHWFRHAAASLLDAAGAPLGTVQTILGHASSQVTRDVYVHEVQSETRNAVEKMQRLLMDSHWTQVSLEAGIAPSVIQ